MPRPVSLAEQAMEAQVGLRDYRRALAPLWSAAMASGDWELMSEVQDLAATLDTSRRTLRRLTSRAESISCPDGIARGGHGLAA